MLEFFAYFWEHKPVTIGSLNCNVEWRIEPLAAKILNLLKSSRAQVLTPCVSLNSSLRMFATTTTSRIL